MKPQDIKRWTDAGYRRAIKLGFLEPPPNGGALVLTPEGAAFLRAYAQVAVAMLCARTHVSGDQLPLLHTEEQ